MVSASLVVVGVLALLNSTEGSKRFVARLPNGANVQGFPAIGHSDGTGDSDKTDAFGDAFQNAGSAWTLDLCQADTDGDGQTNGQELGDPCCEWTQKSGMSPRWTSGVSHPSYKTLTSDPSLWASINCTNVTTISTASSGAHGSLVMEPATAILALATGIALVFA